MDLSSDVTEAQSGTIGVGVLVAVKTAIQVTRRHGA